MFYWQAVQQVADSPEAQRAVHLRAVCYRQAVVAVRQQLSFSCAGRRALVWVLGKAASSVL